MKNINKVILTGTVVGTRASTRSFTMRIATDGGSMRGRNDNVSAYPEVVFSNVREAAEYKVGDRVTVQGHISGRVTMFDGKRRHVMDVIGDKIEQTKRMLASYIDIEPVYGGGYPDDKNIVVVVGSVDHVYTVGNNQFTSVTLTTVTGKTATKNYVTALAFRRQGMAAKELKPGDTVAIAGALRTTNNKDVKIQSQSIVVLDIQKIEEKTE